LVEDFAIPFLVSSFKLLEKLTKDPTTKNLSTT